MRKILLALLFAALPALAQPPYGPGGNPSLQNGVGFQELAKTSWLAATTSSANIALANSASISGVAITGTLGQFSCTCSFLNAGMQLTISGTYGGTGSILGYVNPTTYLVQSVGSGTFVLAYLNGAPVVTTAGTPTGLTYTANVATSSRQVQIFNTTTGIAYVLFCATSTCVASAGSSGTSTSDYPVAPGSVIVKTIPAGTTYAAAILSTGSGAVLVTPGIGL